jgi:hypothetical protein
VYLLEKGCLKEDAYFLVVSTTLRPLHLKLVLQRVRSLMLATQP